MLLDTRKHLERILPFFPLIFSTGFVMANTAAQQPPVQSSNEWLVVIGGLVTIILEYQRRKMAEQNKAIKTTQDSTPDLTAFKELKERVNTLEASNLGMSTQIKMLVSNYEAAIRDRDRVQHEFTIETEAHDHTRQLLRDERETNAGLSRTIDRMETKIAELEHRIEKAEGINELATRIVDTMKDLMKPLIVEPPKANPA